MAHYEIFRRELAAKYPAYGHALWEPSHGDLYPPVEIGDVGFIREGKFHRLFNALLPGDHPSHQNFGVPEHYEPLQLNMSRHIDTGTLSPNNFRSKYVMAVPSGAGVFASEPEPEQVSFSCFRRAGAILSLPVPARRQDTLARGDFRKWIVSHIDHWFAFAQRLGLGISMEDIVLVTGCHLARSWTNMAILEGYEEVRVSFGLRVSGVSNVEWRFLPEDVQGVALNLGPSGQNLPEGECIFIRGLRASSRRLRILSRLRAAAGPPTPGSEPEPETHLTSIPTETNYKDPLHTLLEYIATQAPDCDMTLVHDDDLIDIGNSSPDTLQPDAMMSHLQKSAPRILQVQYGSSEAGKSATKVATLTENPFGADAPQDEDGWTQLHWASFGGDKQLVHSLLERGANVTDRAEDGLTPLHVASFRGHVEVARLFLGYGADKDARTEDRYTPLHMASHDGHVEVVRLLLAHGADVTAQTPKGLTPLHCASRGGHVEVVRVLLENQADVNAQAEDGSTPLHGASSGGHVRVVCVLLVHGADMTAKDKESLTPADRALSKGYKELTRILLEYSTKAIVQDSVSLS